MSYESQSPVSRLTVDQIAASIAAMLDGDWDDVLEVQWSVTSLNERLLIKLQDDNGLQRGFYADITLRSLK